MAGQIGHQETGRGPANPAPERRFRTAGRWLAASVAMLLPVLLAACQSETFRSVDLTPPERITEDVPDGQLLDVGIAVFDGNVPDSYDAARQSLVNPEVRRAESYYMPYLLKSVVESTGNWGAVRVVPESTYAVDVMVTGTVLVSQGERLALSIRARDARGVLWFDKTYRALASKYAYGDALPNGADPFQQIYTQIADDLADHFLSLSAVERQNIRSTAEMRFASDLLPAAYDDYLKSTAAGTTKIARLPARDDPMMREVRRVRQREFLFIDTLDGYYSEYQRRIRPLYQTWRRAAYQESMSRLRLHEKRHRKVVVGTISLLAGVVGGPAAFSAIPTGAKMLRDSFDQQNESEMHAQALREVSDDMESAVMPYTLGLENRTVELTGTVAEQFAKLKKILRDDYYQNLGLPVPAAKPAD